MKVNINFLTATSAMVLLVGCGVTSQDKGLGDAASNVSGVAVDGYVMNAVVYVDTNENNALDIWEPQAITDKSGYFTYNPITEVNYCELPLGDGETVHPNCLKMPAGYSEVLIRITKGYDITTNEPFTGTLSMRVNTSSQTATVPTIATPITGLIAHMDATQKANFFSNETGVNVDNATLDFLNFNDATEDETVPANDEERRTLLALGLKIHKTADIIAGVLDVKFDQGVLNSTTAEGGFFGTASDMPEDASVYAYEAIVNRITSTNGVSDLLADTDLLAGVVSDAYSNMVSVISDYNNTLDDGDTLYEYPGRVGGAASSTPDPDFDLIAGQLVLFTGMIDTILNEGVDVATVDDLKARTRAIDIVASMMRENQEPDVISRARELAEDTTYITNLKDDAVLLATIKSRFIAKAGDVAGLAALNASIADFSGREKLEDLFGDSSAGFGGTDTPGFDGKTLDMGDSDTSVGIAFIGDPVDDGEPPATTGTMTIDATFLGDEFAETDPDTGEQVPLELEGTWEQVDEYTMIMNVEIAGATQPVIVKPTLTENGEAAYYFDLGGEQQIWVP